MDCSREIYNTSLRALQSYMRRPKAVAISLYEEVFRLPMNVCKTQEIATSSFLLLAMTCRGGTVYNSEQMHINKNVIARICGIERWPARGNLHLRRTIALTNHRNPKAQEIATSLYFLPEIALTPLLVLSPTRGVNTAPGATPTHAG